MRPPASPPATLGRLPSPATGRPGSEGPAGRVSTDREIVAAVLERSSGFGRRCSPGFDEEVWRVNEGAAPYGRSFGREERT